VIGSDEEVIAAALEWLDGGQRVALVTVARTFGSSPRPPGALMAASERGDWVGSVSGGCIESQLVARLRADWPQLPVVREFGVTRDDALRAGLPCGGRVEILIEPLNTPAPLRPVLRRMRERKALARHVCLSTGEASLREARTGQEFTYDGENLSKVFGPRWRLLLLGAGQLSRYVASIARSLDYDVVICDPREDYARNWRDDAVTVDARMPDDVVREAAADARCAVIALTHDPALDDLALVEALASSAFYVGALGSHANSARRRDRLLRLGVPADAVARLHGPVGAPIGGKTPAEIAVAILAGVTAARHGRTLRAEYAVAQPAQ
jgi:xanthine dehydrogenase accessory factor